MNAQVQATVAARASQEGTILPMISERGPETKKGKKGGPRSASVPLLGGTNSPDLRERSHLDAKMQRKKGAGRTDAPPKSKKVSTATFKDAIPEDDESGAVKPSSPGSRPPTGGVEPTQGGIGGGGEAGESVSRTGTGKAKKSVLISDDKDYADDFE